MYSSNRLKVCGLMTALISALMLGDAARAGGPAGTTITYQGVLKDNGVNVDGARAMDFRLFDDQFAGSQVGLTYNDLVVVTDGLFTTTVDFGIDPYTSVQPLWLEVTIELQALSRQQVTSAPFSLATRGINVDAGGNVGIGTTTPQAPLDILGQLKFDQVGNSRGMYHNVSGNHFQFTSNNTTEMAGVSFLRMKINGVDKGKVSDSQFEITNDLICDGDVGIGTTSPNEAVHIAHPDRPMILLQNLGDNTAARSAHISFSHDGGGHGARIESTRQAGDNAGMNIRFRTQGTGGGSIVDRMTITSAGNVGIGTSSPASKLDVAGTVTASFFVGDGSGLTNLPVGGGGQWSVNSPDIYFDTGSVGIGTTTPTAMLDVQFPGSAVTDVAIEGTVNEGTGVRGVATAGTGSNFGVYGEALASAAWGVFANGRLGASGTKSFCIDHPLDPANAFLMHYSSEAPEPQNRYNGNVILNGDGMAVVQLPDYFESINANYRYALTAIGAPAPNLHVAQEIADNQFLIAGGVPGQKISWEITAKRSDAFVQQLGAPVQMQKVGAERGRYLTPSLYGMPDEMGINYKAPTARDVR